MSDDSTIQVQKVMMIVERSIRCALSANSPSERTTRLSQAYLATKPENRDAFAMVLIARVAMAGRNMP